MQKKKLYLILLILGTAFWGISFSVTKIGVAAGSLYVFLVYRLALATVILAVFFAKYFKKTDSKNIIGGIMLSVPLTFGIILQTKGLEYLPASQCTFIAGICVILVPVLKLLLYKTVFPGKIWMSSIIALLGLSIISISEGLKINKETIYVILGTIGFSVYLIMVEKQKDKHDIITTIVPMFATSTVICFILAVTDNQQNWLIEDYNFWIGIVYCAVFSTAYMYAVSMISQNYLSAEKVAIIYLFEPVFGAIAAFILLDEPLTWKLLLGGTLILAATLWSETSIPIKKIAKEI
jgi:drug/metabolite transporter (DMT)-like permease